MQWVDEHGRMYTGQPKQIKTKGDLCKTVLHGKGEILTSKGVKYAGYFIYGQKHGVFEVTDFNTNEFIKVLYDYDFIRSEINITK